VIASPSDHLLGGNYEWKKKLLSPLADAPQELLDLVKRAESEGLSGMGIDMSNHLDLPEDVEKAIKFLKTKADPAIQGKGGDNQTYVTIACLPEWGISPQTCFELVEEHYNPRCDPPWEAMDLVTKVKNVYEYKKNDTGCKTQHFEDAVRTKSFNAAISVEKPEENTTKKSPTPTKVIAKSQQHDSTWEEKLAVDVEGKFSKLVNNHTGNSALLMENLKALNAHKTDGGKPLLAYNSFTGENMKLREAPWDILNGVYDDDENKFPTKGDLWSDNDTSELQLFLSQVNLFTGTPKKNQGYQVATKNLQQAVDMIAKRRSFHPIKDKLMECMEQWDGEPRATTWLNTVLGVPLDAYSREVSEMLIMGIIFRTFNAGHKFDYMVVTEGSQDVGKSTMWEKLAIDEEWFTDATVDIEDDKKVIEVCKGKLIVEFGEVADIAKKSVESVKRFLSSKKARARGAYARGTTDFRKSCVFVGTTNEEHWLKDASGNRRFLPVETNVTREDAYARIMLMAELAPQIYGEVMHKFMAIKQECKDTGMALDDYPVILKDPEAIALAKVYQEARTISDDRKFRALKWLDGELEGLPIPAHIPVYQGVAVQVMALDLGMVLFRDANPDSRRQREIRKILSELGWVSSRKRIKRKSGRSELGQVFHRPMTEEKKAEIVGIYGTERTGEDAIATLSNVTAING
ncbi:MAG: virulence-associated E family protein, partial [Proteobacteria bacterium]|nr:virulence-associated E family protein [Pseudomonadota bacterium]